MSNQPGPEIHGWYGEGAKEKSIMNTSVDTKKVKMPTLDELLKVKDLMQQKRDEHLAEMARTLAMVGIQLIPCDHLKDNQFMVSQAMYDAAVKACAAEGK